jgi:hypothetical protein
VIEIKKQDSSIGILVGALSGSALLLIFTILSLYASWVLQNRFFPENHILHFGIIYGSILVIYLFFSKGVSSFWKLPGLMVGAIIPAIIFFITCIYFISR